MTNESKRRLMPVLWIGIGAGVGVGGYYLYRLITKKKEGKPVPGEPRIVPPLPQPQPAPVPSITPKLVDLSQLEITTQRLDKYKYRLNIKNKTTNVIKLRAIIWNESKIGYKYPGRLIGEGWKWGSKETRGTEREWIVDIGPWADSYYDLAFQECTVLRNTKGGFSTTSVFYLDLYANDGTKWNKIVERFELFKVYTSRPEGFDNVLDICWA